MEALLTKEKRAFFKKNKEIDFSYDYLGEPIEQSAKVGARFRGNGFFNKELSVSLFGLYRKRFALTKELNLPPVLDLFTRKQQGFFLVVGPVGHGKSTTLAGAYRLNQ